MCRDTMLTVGSQAVISAGAAMSGNHTMDTISIVLNVAIMVLTALIKFMDVNKKQEIQK